MIIEVNVKKKKKIANMLQGQLKSLDPLLIFFLKSFHYT